KLVGFELTEAGIPRAHYPIVKEGQRVGEVTSGTMGPSVKKAIGIGYVPPALAAEGSTFQVEIRGRPAGAKVVKTPFYKKGWEMADYPSNLKYTKDHEWARKDGAAIAIGVTFHAQESLGDVVYVELPKVGAKVTQGQSFGVIESTKAVSELFSPITGKVTKINSALTDAP